MSDREKATGDDAIEGGAEGDSAAIDAPASEADVSAGRLQDIVAALTPFRHTGQVLNAQLTSVVTYTDEAANEIVSRLQEISQNVHAIVVTVTNAWKHDSALFMQEVQRTLHEREEALTSLRQFMEQREAVVAADGLRWDKLSQDADEMKANVDGIRQLASTARILSINARIEAAHAGEKGRAFDIIASEMRKLSEDVDKIAENVGTRVMSMGAEIRSEHMTEAQRTVQAEHSTLEALGQKLNQLGAFDTLQRNTANLLLELANSTELIANQVMEALASVQFQDITRQKIEHVGKALGQFDVQIANVIAHASTPKGEGLSLDPNAVNVDGLRRGYVMQSQRDIHARLTGDSAGASAPPDAIELFGDDGGGAGAEEEEAGPDIELF